MQSPFLLRNIPNKICLSFCIKYYHVRHYKEDIPQHVHLHCGVQWEIPHCPPWWGKLWPLPQCPPNSEEGFPVQCKLLLYYSWRMSHTGTILFKDMECWLNFTIKQLQVIQLTDHFHSILLTKVNVKNIRLGSFNQNNLPIFDGLGQVWNCILHKRLHLVS